MAKRSGFRVEIDNFSLNLDNFDKTVDFASYSVAASIRSTAEKARDNMIGKIRASSLESDYSKYRKEKGIADPNYYHKETSGPYDSVTKGLVVFDNVDAGLSTNSGQFSLGVGARQRGKGSVQNNYMPASLALELIDKGFSNSQGLVPLTHGREQIKSHWAVANVPGKHFTAGVASEMSSEVNLAIRKAQVVIQGKFAKGYTGPTSGAEWTLVARKYYRSLRKDGGYDTE